MVPHTLNPSTQEAEAGTERPASSNLGCHQRDRLLPRFLVCELLRVEPRTPCMLGRHSIVIRATSLAPKTFKFPSSISLSLFVPFSCLQ